jgi:hypothetical protein
MRRLLVIVSFVACAPQGTPSNSDEVEGPHEVLVAKAEEHAKIWARAAQDCGSVAVPLECRGSLSEAELCFLNAKERCEAARLMVLGRTDEGAAIATIGFVQEGKDGSCELTQFVDNHLDGFKGDYGDIIQSRCGGVFQPQDRVCNTFLAWERCQTLHEWHL